MPKFVDYITGKTAVTSHADSDIGVMIQGGVVKKFTLTTLKVWIKAITEIADAISKRHSAGTDAGLDTGGSNAVTAADLKTLKDTTVPAKADKVATSPAPTGYVATFDENGNLSVSAKEVSEIGSSTAPTPEAESDFQVATGSPLAWAKKTLAEVKTILGLVLAQTAEAVGFTLAGGTTSKTLTVDEDVTVSNLASKYPSDLELTTDTVVTEAQAITLHGTGGVLTNQGATGEVDVTLPAISYRVKFPILAEEAQVIEVGPPTDEVLYLNGTALDANDCVDSDGVEGSMIQAFRHKDSSGNWHWYLVTITGVWTDTGASD